MAQLQRRINPQFNLVQLQHADVEIKLPGANKSFDRVTKIGYSAKVRDRTKIFGAAPQAMGITRGGLDYEASLAIHRAARDEFQRAIKLAGRGVFDSYVPIIVSFNHPDWNVVETDTLYVMIDALGFSSGAGPSVLELDIPVTCGYIDFGGGGAVIAGGPASIEQFKGTDFQGPGF